MVRSVRLCRSDMVRLHRFHRLQLRTHVVNFRLRLQLLENGVIDYILPITIETFSVPDILCRTTTMHSERDFVVCPLPASQNQLICVLENRKWYYFADRTIDKNCMTNRRIGRNYFALRSDLTKKPRPSSPNEYNNRPNLTHLATVLTVLLFNKHKHHCSLQ